MSVRINNGWQSILADLSLILFMITASFLQAAPTAPHVRQAHPRPDAVGPDRATPIAIYRADTDAPPLAKWLAAQSPDPRALLTIAATYQGAGRDRAISAALDLADQAAAHHIAARIIVEPGPSSAAVATLGYDRSTTD